MDVSATPCPACHEPRLRVEWRMAAKPFGSQSLPGVQLKTTATETPWIVCGSCGAEAQGRRE